MIVTILLLLIFILLVWNYYVHHGRKGRLINLIPGIPGVPIFGLIFLLLLPIDVLWKGICDMNNKYYPILKVWIFFIPIVIIRHPDDLKIILSSTKYVEKSSLYNFLNLWFGTGLFTSTGAKWRSHRKILTPAFHFDILQQFVDVLVKEGNSMTKSLKDIRGIVIKDLVPFIGEHTVNVICRTTMGISLQDQGKLQQLYQEIIDQMSTLCVYRLMRPWLYNDFIFALFPKGRMHMKTLKTLHEFIEKIIAERKLYHERTNYQYLKNFDKDNIAEINNAKVFGILKKQFTLLDILIAASREGHLTDLDIREEINTVVFKGYTVTMAITTVLSLLAEHKDIQEHVRIEINTVIQENGEKFTMQLLQNLPYLDRCIKETLRLYPSILFILRVTLEDVKLKSCLIPNETILYLDIYGVHRDPNFWPNPDVFDPDRFLPEKIQNRHPYSYLPFSAGSRNCIGQQYAMLAIKAMIVPLIRNFYLEPIDYLKDLWIDPTLSLRPNHPVRARFVPIECAEQFK